MSQDKNNELELIPQIKSSETEIFIRKCEICEKPMNTGYLVNDVTDICSDDCLGDHWGLTKDNLPSHRDEAADNGDLDAIEYGEVRMDEVDWWYDKTGEEMESSDLIPIFLRRAKSGERGYKKLAVEMIKEKTGLDIVATDSMIDIMDAITDVAHNPFTTHDNETKDYFQKLLVEVSANEVESFSSTISKRVSNDKTLPEIFDEDKVISLIHEHLEESSISKKYVANYMNDNDFLSETITLVKKEIQNRELRDFFVWKNDDTLGKLGKFKSKSEAVKHNGIEIGDCNLITDRRGISDMRASMKVEVIPYAKDMWYGFKGGDIYTIGNVEADEGSKSAYNKVEDSNPDADSIMNTESLMMFMKEIDAVTAVSTQPPTPQKNQPTKNKMDM